MIMGRTARTNCSQFEAAMKKYHDDIGSRLSATLMPEQCGKDNAENLSQDFCMLTINPRHMTSLKQRADQSDASKCQVSADEKGNAASKISTASSGLLKTTSDLSTANDQENRSQEKRGLFDKLTCAMFHRKHMCARCKRRSRSCISSKTFLGSEKRYTCYRCRETSQVVKTRTNEDSRLSHSAAGRLRASHGKDRSLSKHRTHKKDSGYETVTSCSTVASTYSVFNTPANSRHNKDKANLQHSLSGEHILGSKRNVNILKITELGTKHKSSADELSTSNFVDNSDSELTNFTTNELDESHVSTERDNGYIPEPDHQEQSRPRSVLADVSNLDDISEDVDSCYVTPRIIRVSQPDKVALPPTQKACYTCDSTSKPCFRLPWEGGWICEDCLDGLH